jgi:hypothetical protein
VVFNKTIQLKRDSEFYTQTVVYRPVTYYQNKNVLELRGGNARRACAEMYLHAIENI